MGHMWLHGEIWFHRHLQDNLHIQELGMDIELDSETMDHSIAQPVVQKALQDHRLYVELLSYRALPNLPN